MILTFDCYGTLLDTSSINECISNICYENNVNSQLAINAFFSYEDRLMYSDEIIPYEKLIRKNLQFMDMDLDTDDLFLSNYKAILQAYYDLKPFPEVTSVLEDLKKAGHSLYLMSNSSSQIMQYNLQTLNKDFDDVFTADDTGCYKPQLEFFSFVQRKLNLNNNNHLHIAKGFWWDIVPCAKIGWKKIWINRNRINGLKEYQPYKEFNDLRALPTYLKTIQSIEDKNIQDHHQKPE